MLRTRSIGGVVIGPTKQVLVVSQHGTSWSLIKGTVEEGEEDMTTALREFKEEAGITNVTFVRKLGMYERYVLDEHGQEDTSEYKTITIYLCTTNQTELVPEDPENPEAIWVDPTKVAERLTHPKDKVFYESVQQEVLDFIEQNTSDS